MMIASIKRFIRRYPEIMKTYSFLVWKKYRWSDWLNTYIFIKKNQFDTPFGFKMIARNYIANRMMMHGIFETEEVELIKKNLLATDVFVDVGANIGLYTCIACSLGKYVLAVEPQSQNLECLYYNIKYNNWQKSVEVFPLGLSSEPDLLTLYGASGPSASLIGGWAGYSKRFKSIISVNTLDMLVGDRFVGKKLFIKIDVEGAEYNVLRGALKTLDISPRPTWFIEICLNEFHPTEMNPYYEATFDLFWQHGYEARMANKEFILVTPGDIKSWIYNKRSISNNINYLFIPKQ
jgi:FkbM family methyltransferase